MSSSVTDGPCWELEERQVDTGVFFRSLASSFPEATTAFFDGFRFVIATDVVAIFERHVDPGPYLPESETSHLKFRCRFTTDLCNELGSESLRHGGLELCHNMFLYAGVQPLLEWPDAFFNCIWIAHSISEERVAAFAACLSLPYAYANYG